MSKFRLPIAVLCVLTSLLCAVWAKEKSLSPEQQEQKQACDKAFNDCFKSCGFQNYDCQDACADELGACYGNIGISAPPKVRLPDGRIVQPQGTLTQASPTVAPTRVRQPQGTLTQASPTAPPKRLTRQPQGSLTQASPTASPNKILSATPKKLQPQGTLTQASPAPTQRPRNVHHDQKKEKKN